MAAANMQDKIWTSGFVACFAGDGVPSARRSWIRSFEAVCCSPRMQSALLRADLRMAGGRIVEIAPTIATQACARVIDARGQWVLPGFVQAHVHLTQTLFRGLADDRELLHWLRERIWPLEAAHTAESNYLSAELGIAELLSSGTTTILDMGTTHHHDTIFSAVGDFGLRYYGGKALMDQGEHVPASLLEPMDAAMAACDAHHARWHGSENGRIQCVYAPRFILSCSDALMREVGRRSAAQGTLIHTHASENRAEIEAVTAITGAANLRALQARGCLNARTVVAHGVWVDGDEERCLLASGAALCHCPGSNLKLASGVSPVPHLLSCGVRIGLGADGAACNNELDQRTEMRLAALLHRIPGGAAALSPQQVLDLATRGGALALGAFDRIGSLEVGKCADVIVMQPGLSSTPVQDPVAALVFAAATTAVREVFIDGIPRLSRGELLDINAQALSARALAAREALVARAGLR